MDYDNYFDLCRESYKMEFGLDKLPSLKSFYDDPVVRVPIENFSPLYMESILSIKDRVKNHFDKNPNPPMAEYPSNFDFKSELSNIAKDLVGWLEEERYGCYLYVDNSSTPTAVNERVHLNNSNSTTSASYIVGNWGTGEQGKMTVREAFFGTWSHTANTASIFGAYGGS